MDPLDLKSTADQLTSSQDFTIYWPYRNPLLPQELLDHFSENKPTATNLEMPEPSKSKGSFNREVPILLPDSNPSNPSNARSCICRCYRSTFLSATLRSDDAPSGESLFDPKTITKDWKCSPWGKGGKFLLESFELIDGLFRSIWQNKPTDHPSGLVVFSGSTNSAKSKLAQAFTLEIVRRAVNAYSSSERLPHLVTFEDPIESWKITTKKSHPKQNCTDAGIRLDHDPLISFQYGFCFTPRERTKDVDSIEEALTDAKRQTPVCFYVGEVRQPDDWEKIIEFAGSGHMVVTTTHAGRLPEAVLRLIDATHAITPAHRRNVGSYVTACIHLERQAVGDATSGYKDMIFPSLWAHRGAALASLVADGVSSITPNGDYVLSHSQFLEKHFLEIKKPIRPHNSADAILLKLALKKARELDVEDLLHQ